MDLPVSVFLISLHRLGYRKEDRWQWHQTCLRKSLHDHCHCDCYCCYRCCCCYCYDYYFHHHCYCWYYSVLMTTMMMMMMMMLLLLTKSTMKEIPTSRDDQTRDCPSVSILVVPIHTHESFQTRPVWFDPSMCRLCFFLVCSYIVQSLEWVEKG